MILKWPSGFESPVFSTPDLLFFKVLINAARLTAYSVVTPLTLWLHVTDSVTVLVNQGWHFLF